MSNDDASSGEEEYEVEKILRHKYTPAGYQYFVRWKGYGPGDDCWTSAKGFSAPELEAAYWGLKNKKTATPKSVARGSVDRTTRNTPGSSHQEISQESSAKRSSTRRIRNYKESSTDDDYSSGSDMRAGSDSPRPKKVRQKYRGAAPSELGRSFEEQDDNDAPDDNVNTAGSRKTTGSGVFSSVGSPPAQEMDAFNCFEKKVVIQKYSPPYEITPEPEAAVSHNVGTTNNYQNAYIPQEELRIDPNQEIDIFKREPEEAVDQEQPAIELPKRKTLIGNSSTEIDADSDIEWDDRRDMLPAPPSPQGDTVVHEESKTILTDVFQFEGSRDTHNVLLERLVKIRIAAGTSNSDTQTWIRRVEIKILEDVWQDDFWTGMTPMDISDAYNTHCNKLIANQCFLEDNNERLRLEYIYKKRHLEKLILAWKLLKKNHINLGKIPTKILAVVSETFTNPETEHVDHKYYGVVEFWKCPGVAQQMLWSELCDKCPKIVNKFRLDYLEHKKMLNGFHFVAPHIKDDNRFWMDEGRRFGYRY